MRSNPTRRTAPLALATALIAACCCSTTPASAQPTPDDHADTPFTPLFNANDLTGWISTGDPDAWTVRDNEIVTAKPGQGGWLRTDRMYRDFILELEFWLPEGGNSGVGLRGSSSGDPAFTGFEVQILDTHDEQPNLRNCGAVYEAIPPQSMPVTEPGQWNTYRISLIDDTLNVWLNDTQIHTDAKLDDRGFFRSPESPLPLSARMTTGYIALQDHGHPFRYRNIRIKDLSPDPEPNGMEHLITDTLEGWVATHAASWSIEDAHTLTGRGGPGHLFSERRVGDFELRALVRVNTRGNSGIYFRVKPNPDTNIPWPVGYEAQIDNHDPKNFTGVIYDKAWPAEEAPQSPITRDNEWFDYRIRARGKHIQTWINGVRLVNTSLEEFNNGAIAVQGHHPGNTIEFRDIRIIDIHPW
ncbi:MAG: 3-keto-disaccharide hydrolase [Phycisphaerales bacterium]